ncbi:MAG: flagellar basal body rod protein FlgC [Acidimicrobiia bacterium]|nr:flagellar basal body rod protein FlgC [Acidimicrobiia bacterium]
MAIFGTLQTAGSGLTVYRTWLDAVADNVANINTVTSTDDEAFRARFVVAQARQAESASGVGGVDVLGVVFGDPEGRLLYDPGHPLADEEGLVRAPDIDLGDQMVQMMLAQRAYQANLAVIDRARDAYQQAIAIGRR